MNKVGLSLAFCVRDIITGKVKEEDVAKIIATTSVKTKAEWSALIEEYKQLFWRNNPMEGEAICRRFLKAGKVEQPLLKGKQIPDLSNIPLWRDLNLEERLEFVLKAKQLTSPKLKKYNNFS
jgi:hypothetical protein